jgi:hypothetical protein
VLLAVHTTGLTTERGIMLEYKGIIKPFGGQALGNVRANVGLQELTFRRLSLFNTQLT